MPARRSYRRRSVRRRTRSRFGRKGKRKRSLKRFSRMLTRVGRPRAEIKSFTMSFDDVNITATRQDYDLLTGITQGLEGTNITGGSMATHTFNNRIGDKIYIQSFLIVLFFESRISTAQLASGVVTPTRFRMRLIRWKGRSEITANLNLILGAQDGIADINYCRTNHNATEKPFRVLVDKMRALIPSNTVVPVTAAGAQIAYAPSVGNVPQFWRYRRRMRVNKQVTYRGIGSAIVKMNDFTLHLQSNSTADPISLSGYFTIYFSDA